MQGYNINFLGVDKVVRMPNYDKYSTDIALNQKTNGHRLDYIYYTIIQSKSRRVPIVSASNIFRIKFERVERAGNFKKDDRIYDNEQLTANDFRQFNSIKAATIEKGHMTKREDVQWDIHGNELHAQIAAESTFYYPNSVPQHDSLNNGPWKHLENSIIIKGRVPKPAKISVFTGPVLDPEDPEFKVKLYDGTAFRIPVLFWKIIYYIKEDNTLYYAGFLMGQINPLRRDELIDEIGFREFEIDQPPSHFKPFLEFKEDENYQVPVSLIEQLTGLGFQNAVDRHANIKPTALKLEEIQIRDFESNKSELEYTFEISGLLV